MDKEKELITVLNKMWSALDPVMKDEFNNKFLATNDDNIEYLETLSSSDLRLGIVQLSDYEMGMTTLSLLATVTDILVGKRLAVQVDMDTNRIVGWQWYTGTVINKPLKLKVSAVEREVLDTKDIQGEWLSETFENQGFYEKFMTDN